MPTTICIRGCPIFSPSLSTGDRGPFAAECASRRRHAAPRGEGRGRRAAPGASTRAQAPRVRRGAPLSSESLSVRTVPQCALH